MNRPVGSGATACRLRPWCRQSSKKGTVLARELPDQLSAMGPVSPPIHDRVAVVESAVLGRTVATYAPGSLCHQEFEELGRYVLAQLKEVG